jgi:hypothetical protein
MMIHKKIVILFSSSFANELGGVYLFVRRSGTPSISRTRKHDGSATHTHIKASVCHHTALFNTLVRIKGKSFVLFYGLGFYSFLPKIPFLLLESD